MNKRLNKSEIERYSRQIVLKNIAILAELLRDPFEVWAASGQTFKRFLKFRPQRPNFKDFGKCGEVWPNFKKIGQFCDLNEIPPRYSKFQFQKRF